MVRGLPTCTPVVIKVHGAWKSKQRVGTWRTTIAWSMWWNHEVADGTVKVFSPYPTQTEFLAILQGL